VFCLKENYNNEIEMRHLKEEKRNKTYHEMAHDSHIEERVALDSTSSLQNISTEDSKPQIVKKIRIAKPDVIRGMLREVLMLLVISNASLWIFLSLDKTLFTTLAYQYDFFGHGVWTTITAITTPLSIFLRMHSSACFFELWSYA